MMKRYMGYSAATFLALTLWGVGTQVALGQEEQPSPAKSADGQREQVDHEVQLYLLQASDGSGERSDLPPLLGDAVKQLKATLPFSNYRLAATLLSRVRDGGNLEVSGVGGLPLMTTPANPNAPTFFNFNLGSVALVKGANNQPFIQVARFRFGLKVPVQTATTRVEGGSAGYPVIQYQDTGLSTGVSVREGVPTILGTLPASQTNETYVLVLNLKRTAVR